MPNIQYFSSPERKTQRFRVKATGEIGSALSNSHGSHAISRLATIGPELNVQIIDLCVDTTGEVRSYRAEYLEDVTE